MDNRLIPSLLVRLEEPEVDRVCLWVFLRKEPRVVGIQLAGFVEIGKGLFPVPQRRVKFSPDAVCLRDTLVQLDRLVGQLEYTQAETLIGAFGDQLQWNPRDVADVIRPEFNGLGDVG